MQLFNIIVPDDFNIFLYGDDHEGSTLRYEQGFNAMVNMMHTEFEGCSHNIAIDHGDPIEAITVDDKRYDRETTKEGLVLQQIDDAVKNREPIKHMIACMVDGNHPRKLWRFGAITKKICERLGVAFGTYASIVSYRSWRDPGYVLFRHYVTHGFCSVTSSADDPKRRRANMELSLKRSLKFKANCLLNSMGHTHKLLTCKPQRELYLTVEDSGLQQQYTGGDSTAAEYIHPDLKWYANTGSFLKLNEIGVSGYAEVAGFDPIELGFCVAMVRDGKLQDVREVTV